MMRLSEGRLNKARKGKYAGGGVPMGYRPEGKDLIPSGQRSETARILKCWLDGIDRQAVATHQASTNELQRRGGID